MLEAQLLLPAPPDEAKQSLPPDVKHNTYNLFVTKHDDLIGLIAYSLYKQHKIDFLTQYRANHDGARPSEETVDVFLSIYRNPSQVEMHKARANELLGSFTEELLRVRENAIEKAYHDELVRQLKEGPGFWSGVWIGVVGNITFTAVIALLIFIISVSSKGLTPAIIDALSGDPKPITSPATPKAPPALGQPTVPGG